jgi:hypothetical protein
MIEWSVDARTVGGHWDVGPLQCVDDAVLPEYVVCSAGGLARRGPPEHKVTVTEGDVQRLVRMALGVALDAERPYPSQLGFEVRAQPFLVHQPVEIAAAFRH